MERGAPPTEEIAGAEVRDCPGCARTVGLAADPQERQRHCPHCGTLVWGGSVEEFECGRAHGHIKLARLSLLALAGLGGLHCGLAGWGGVWFVSWGPWWFHAAIVACSGWMVVLWLDARRRPMRAFCVGRWTVRLIAVVGLVWMAPLLLEGLEGLEQLGGMLLLLLLPNPLVSPVAQLWPYLAASAALSCGIKALRRLGAAEPSG